MYISIYDLQDIIGYSVTTIRNFMLKDKEIDALFEIFKVKGSRNTTYKKIMFDDVNVELLKQLIYRFELRRKEARKQKHLYNRSVRDCVENNMDCDNCNSENKRACKYFIKVKEIPPIKKVVMELIDKYGVMVK